MKNLFDIKGKVVVLTGGCGVLGQCIARYLAEQGAHMVILDRVVEVGKQFEAELNQLTESLFLETNVLDAAKLEQNCKDILAKFGTIDVLLNAAGGNMGAANIAPDQTFLDASDDAIHKVVELNLFGTILPTKVFGRVICEKKEGAIVNFCSESALRPLTRVFGYGCRVNAIVPGFLITNQNRALLTNPDGTLTARGADVIRQTPAARFAEPEELCGTIHYLISEASSFVTGALSVVDGGFDVFSI